MGHLTWVELQQLQEQCYLILVMYATLSCFQTMIWLPVWGIFNVHSCVDACGCTQEWYECHERVSAESWLWEKTLATQQKQTQVSIAPGFLVQRSTSWATSPPVHFVIYSLPHCCFVTLFEICIFLCSAARNGSLVHKLCRNGTW